jgi:hypothetical protein
MLVAVASFVLHGGALASHHAHGPASIGCAAGDHHGAHHDGHDHGHGHHYAHAGSGADETGSEGDDSAGSPCCTGLCAMVLAAVAPDAASAPMRPARVSDGEARLAAGIDPGGLKRPPRTTDIAA